MKQVMIAIKPEYTAKIKTGNKIWEFRRKIPNKNYSNCAWLIYESKTKKIIGEIFVAYIICKTDGKISELYDECIYGAGISRDKFDYYFKGASIAYAIKIGRFVEYRPHRSLLYYGVANAPQNFIYINTTKETMI